MINAWEKGERGWKPEVIKGGKSDDATETQKKTPDIRIIKSGSIEKQPADEQNTSEPGGLLASDNASVREHNRAPSDLEEK